MPSGSGPRAIGVVSKAPVVGQVKSRLASDLGDEAAARLYTAFLRDVLVGAAAIPRSRVTVFHPLGDHINALRALLPPGATLATERGRGYSEILPDALRRMLASTPVAALLGADSPGVPEGIIRRGFEAVESGESDVAIGPAADGGYYLLITGADHPGLFGGIEWSTERVFEQMVARAAALGLRVEVLPAWYDVDTLADLERLAADLAGNAALGAEATRATLRTLARDGVPAPVGEPPWNVEERRVIYSTPWRTLVEDRLITHAGESIDYTYLRTGEAVWVVPVTGDGRIVLVRQYRHPVGQFVLEVPAGGGDGDPEELARRELLEETGGRAGRLIPVASYFPASAHTTHRGHVYVATEIAFGADDLESTELLRAFSVPFELALDMARRGEIGDSQSALAILAAEPVIRRILDDR